MGGLSNVNACWHLLATVRAGAERAFYVNQNGFEIVACGLNNSLFAKLRAVQ